jgi:hypothetical protein
MKDEDPTPEEQREAEALARALDGGAGDPPADALATAGLLRYARGEGLDPTRAAALRAKARPRPRRRWVWVVAPLAVAAALILFLVPATTMYQVQSVPQPAAPTAPSWPPPTAALLEAQAAAARGGPGALERLDTGMRSYRQALFARLRSEGPR